MTKEQFSQTDQYIASLRPIAEQGDRIAQFDLGLSLWKNGDYRYKSEFYNEAVGWWRKAAMQGDGRAQYNLAYLYASGFQAAIPYSAEDKSDWHDKLIAARKVGQPEANVWLSVSAQGGHIQAQYELVFRV